MKVIFSKQLGFAGRFCLYGKRTIFGSWKLSTSRKQQFLAFHRLVLRWFRTANAKSFHATTSNMGQLMNRSLTSLPLQDALLTNLPSSSQELKTTLRTSAETKCHIRIGYGISFNHPLQTCKLHRQVDESTDEQTELRIEIRMSFDILKKGPREQRRSTCTK